jgi:DHA1 family tetracycline resistance protein-like MFS transporter
MTRRVAPDEQGRLQGAVASLMGIAGVTAPILFTQTFSAAVGPYASVGIPGAPFLLAGGLLVMAIVVGLTIEERRVEGTVATAP